jgi:hypothetical protein
MKYLNEVDAFFKSRGAVRASVSGVEKNRWGSVEFSAMFQHYFNADGGEVGYVTLPLLAEGYYTNLMPQQFFPARVWDRSFVASLREWRTL